MAFVAADLRPIGYAGGTTNFTMWVYDTTDAIATVDGSGYFNDASDDLEVGDLILVLVRSAVTLGTAATDAGFVVVASNASGVVDTTDETAITVTDGD